MNGSLQLGNRYRDKPRKVHEARYCFCGVRISRYNGGKTCYLHAPYRKPRIRGRSR